MTDVACPPLTSFADDMNVVVIGASGGIGGAMTRLLAQCPKVGKLIACSRSARPARLERVDHHAIDLLDETTIAAAAESAGEAVGGLDLVLIATGLPHEGDRLQPEKTWRALEAGTLERAFRINTIGPALIAKHFLPLLARDRKSVLAALSARVGSISDNRLGGWHGYRASKAALNMLIRTFAIELARRNPEALCVGLHPGTVATALSAPFRASIPDDQLFTPDIAAAQLISVLDGLDASDSGHLLAWDGQKIAF
jgi:NAD(P)-dependent dehydrogenase (short-subunit alcohol dehydrogenase family)